MLGRNVTGSLGEIDIVARAGNEMVVVEVKTITDPRGTPLARIDAEKADRLWRLARSIGASRVEYIGLRLHPSGVRIEWLPG